MNRLGRIVLIGWVLLFMALLLTFMSNGCQTESRAHIPARPGNIVLPPLPGDVQTVLNIDNDPVRGVCVGYVNRDGFPRLVQYSFVYENGDVRYNSIHRFCFRERGQRAPRGYHVLPPLPRSCTRVVSITNDPRVGVSVGFINKDGIPELVQYSYVEWLDGDTFYPEDKVYRFEFRK